MLYSETMGSGPDIIFLHGLFGAGDNWRTVARNLSDTYCTHLLDLPNHGRSDWLDNSDLPSLATLINDWIKARGLTNYRLLGHSMGGKVAMEMALNKHEGDIAQLIIVDIAPKAYEPHHQDVFKALNRADLSELPDRKAVDENMKDLVIDASIRQFLLKSLHKKEGKLTWRFNVRGLEGSYGAVACAPNITQPFEQPTLFIKGMNSDYILAQDQTEIMELFPNAKAKLIEGAGHWPHAEKPLVFTKILKDFLDKEDI